jgi:ABC-type sugar transport system permease subunit/outer membrane protein assembly factor BamB
MRVRSVHLPKPPHLIISGLCLVIFLVSLVVPLVRVSAQAGNNWELPADSIVHSVAVATDGSAVVVGSRNGLVFYLDRSGQQVWTFDTGGTVLGLSINQDGQRVMAATESRKVFVLDGEGNLLWEKSFDFVLISASMSGSGDLIALVPKAKIVWVLDGEGNPLWEMPYDTFPSAVAVSPDGQRVAVGLRDAYVHLYDRGGSRIWQTQMNSVIRGIAFSADAAFLAVGDEAQKGYLVKNENNAPEIVWTYEAGDKVTSVAITADGQQMAVGSYDQSAYLLDETGQVKIKKVVDGRITSVALSGDGSVFVFGSDDNKAYGYDVQSGKVGYSASLLQGRVLAITIPLVVLAVIAGATSFLRYVPSGKRFWAKYGKGIRKLVKEIWRAKVSYMLLAPTIALLVIFNYYPAFSGLFHSFTKWNPGVGTRWIGLENFQNILINNFFWSGLLNAVILIVTGFVKTLTMPLLVAELLFHLRSRITQYWLRSLFIFPIIIPGVAIILIWRNILDPNIGLLNNFLSLIGLMDMSQPQAWLGDTRTAIWSIVFIGFPWISPFALLLFYGGLISIPVELFDAAKVDGANSLQRFRHIDLPLLMGQIKLLLILGFIGGMQEFSLIFLTTEGGPYNATYTPALELYYQAMRFNNFGLASAMGTVLFLIILGGTIFNLRMRTSTEYQA